MRRSSQRRRNAAEAHWDRRALLQTSCVCLRHDSRTNLGDTTEGNIHETGPQSHGRRRARPATLIGGAIGASLMGTAGAATPCTTPSTSPSASGDARPSGTPPRIRRQVSRPRPSGYPTTADLYAVLIELRDDYGNPDALISEMGRRRQLKSPHPSRNPASIRCLRRSTRVDIEPLEIRSKWPPDTEPLVVLGVRIFRLGVSGGGPTRCRIRRGRLR